MRQSMKALQNKFYFNYGGQGPLPTDSLEAIKASWEKIQELGPFTNDVWPYMFNEIQKTKEYLSQICGINHHQLALTENVTSGCVLPLWGLPFHESERILISDCEHPGVVAACRELARRKKLHIDILSIQKFRNGIKNINSNDELILIELKKSLTKKTKLVVISHILWNTGQIMPIQEISKTIRTSTSKPYLLVDAAQSFGQIPIRDAAANSDIFAFTGHKWAFGPEGLGGVAISERVIDESSPTFIGWKSLQKEKGIYVEDQTPFHTDARRFEIATSCIPLLAGLRSSLDLLKSQGSESKRLQRIQTLSKQLWNGLNEINGINTILNSPPPTGLVSFSLSKEKSEHSLVKNLGKQKIWIRVLEDPEWLRACLHVTSNEKEVETLLNAISKFC
tara:strand:+ start:1821 stop:2999 length:1179 start_codon:yes stop_codon:yes gene_type:complete